MLILQVTVKQSAGVAAAPAISKLQGKASFSGLHGFTPGLVRTEVTKRNIKKTIAA